MDDELGSIHGVDSSIACTQELLLGLPRSHPTRLIHIYNLAVVRVRRYGLSNEVDDLNKAILHLTESILLPSHSWLEHGPLVFRALLLLAFALFGRSVGSKLPGDTIYAAKYLRHLRDQPHAALGFLRHPVASLLVDVLGSQVELEAGNELQKIEEMAVLCHELLTSDPSSNETTLSVTTLSDVVQSKIPLFIQGRPMDQLIECLRLARMRKPELRDARLALAVVLGCRYFRTYANDNYDEAVSALDEIIASGSPGDSRDEVVARAQVLVTKIAAARSRAHESPEYVEEALYRARVFLKSYPVEGPLYPAFNRFWENYSVEKYRFNHFGFIDGVEASFGDPPLFQLMPAVSFKDRFDETEEMNLLKGFLLGIPNSDITKIDEAIENGRSILASSDPRHPFSTELFSTFGGVLFEVFQRTKKLEHLNESISTCRQVFERPCMQSLRLGTICQLSWSLITRSLYFLGHRTQDLDEALELLSQYANNRHAVLPNRLRSAWLWVSNAQRTRHPSILLACESAVSLMQDTLLFSPTLHLQHATLATSSYVHRIPLDYVSYQVDLRLLEEAVETLERGRALLWSEMRYLRAPLDRLLQEDPQLGREFAAVNLDLEELTKSIAPSLDLNMDDDAADDVRAADSFGRLLLKQRRLLKERDDLILRIRALPGFDSFLTPPSFDTLRSAARSGPIIIINHSKCRSDILILCYNTYPSLIPTPGDFYDRTSALKDELLDARNKFGPDLNHYNQTLAYVLTELYNLIGKPVVDRLRQLKVPEQSRVWWCPTSVLCSLPLHAMGPIPSDGGGEERYFLDIYIPSYTPMLSALIPESDHRDPGSSTLGLPSLLLVAHFDVPSPDVSLSEVCEDVKVVQALNTRLPIKSLISEGATTTSTLDGLRDHRFVHFVCHGTLEASKPFDAGFELHGSERLTLLDIVRSRLPAAEFAFLSACHTAELTDGSSADESLHLAAAVQYCGFRSVVGTMWAMANQDGPDLAKHFYKSMFPRREKGEPVPYYKRSAGALRDAVKKLRKKRGITLERWVNFVHYGA
ncbi:CHAT domain-containing protein [Lactarius psammicola]|nr:CHAT domain-containing protein [Lactarius psammicola]